jgi:hypothetical protein
VATLDDAEFITCDIGLVQQNPFGEVKSGRLRVKGRTQSLFRSERQYDKSVPLAGLYYFDPQLGDYDYHWGATKFELPEDVSNCILRYYPKNLRKQAYKLLLIGSTIESPDDGRNHDSTNSPTQREHSKWNALIIDLVEGEPSVYRRVGIASFENPNISIENWAWEIVSLV